MPRHTITIRSVRTRRARLFALGITVAVAACNAALTDPTHRPSIVGVAADVAQAAAAVTGEGAPIANNVQKGRFLGFDTHTYPGTATMRAWKNTPGSPYKWVGYYLPSPCHADASWTGKRDTLQAMGWGLAIVYVGEQTWGRTPRPLTPSQRDAVRKHDACASDLVSADEGTRNADDATARASAEGFAHGSVVFLDLERMETIPDAMRDYYKAWTARMIANGQFRPGFYTHQHNAPVVFTDVRDVLRAAGDTETPRMWIAGGKGFQESRAPQDVGYAFAGVWQGVLDVARSVGHLKLPVDLNVASWQSPSEVK